MARDVGLWERYSDGESLLFQRSDFLNTEESPIFQELRALAELDRDETLADAVARMEDACRAGAMSTLLPGIDAPVEELSASYDPIKPTSPLWATEETVQTTLVTESVKVRQWWTLPEVVTRPVGGSRTTPRPRTVTVATQDSFNYIERASTQETLREEEKHLNSWRFGLALFVVAIATMVFAQNPGFRFFMAGPFFALLVNLGRLGYDKWPRKAIYDELSAEIEKMEKIIDDRKKKIVAKGGAFAASNAGSLSDFIAEKLEQISINRVVTVSGVKTQTLRLLHEEKVDNALALKKRGILPGLAPDQMTALLNWCQAEEAEASKEYRRMMGTAEVTRLRYEVAEFERHLAHLKRERDQFPDAAFATYFRRLFGAESPTAVAKKS
jgi:hypothetical protein